MGVDSHRDSLHEQLSHLPQHHHGSHQKEDAGYEGGEGQRLRPRGRLRGAVQSCQAEGVQGRGRGDDEGEAAGDRAGPHHREARHCHPPAGGEGEAAGSEAPSWLPSPPSSRCGSPSRSTTSAAPPSSTASASKRTLTLQASAKRRGKQYTGSNRHHLHLLVSGVIPCFLFNHFSIIWPFGDSTIRLSTTFLLQL